MRDIVLYDLSHVPVSEVVSQAFRFSHLVLASSTYNGGIFTPMEELLLDLKAHNLQNRTVAMVENGSWAAVTARLMGDIVGAMKNMTVLEDCESALLGESGQTCRTGCLGRRPGSRYPQRTVRNEKALPLHHEGRAFAAHEQDGYRSLPKNAARRRPANCETAERGVVGEEQKSGPGKERHDHRSCLSFWYARLDSNQRPSESESDALSNCATGAYQSLWQDALYQMTRLLYQKFWRL